MIAVGLELFVPLVLQNLQSCDLNRACVECEENIASSETDCSSLNCSVVRIDPVETEEYFIDGKHETTKQGVQLGLMDVYLICILNHVTISQTVYNDKDDITFCQLSLYVSADTLAIRCDFLDGDNCLRAFYITNTRFSSGPIHSEQTGMGRKYS